jgi:hypothetical protein
MPRIQDNYHGDADAKEGPEDDVAEYLALEEWEPAERPRQRNATRRVYVSLVWRTPPGLSGRYSLDLAVRATYLIKLIKGNCTRLSSVRYGGGLLGVKTAHRMTS